MIGAGVLGIPYVVMKSGFGYGMISMVVVAIAILITMLYLGEIAQRTKSNHQLAGYAAKYLGKKGKVIMFISVAFGIYAAILAYLIAEGQSLSFIFFGHTEYAFAFGLIFWAVMSALVYFGIKALEEGEVVGVVLIIILILGVVIYSINKIDVSNLIYNNSAFLFLPFGVILFAFLAFSAVPEVERIIGKEKWRMKRSIIAAHIIVFTIYTIFAAVVLGTYGTNTPPIATLALGKAFVLLGILTIFTSYLSLSIAFIDSLRFDFKKSKRSAWLWTIIVPLIIYIILQLFQSANFTTVLGIGGVISGGLAAILILFIAKKAKIHGDATPSYSIPYSKIIVTVLILIFVAGAVLEIMNMF